MTDEKDKEDFDKWVKNLTTTTYSMKHLKF